MEGWKVQDDLLRELISVQIQYVTMNVELSQMLKESLQMLRECYQMCEESLQKLGEIFDFMKSQGEFGTADRLRKLLSGQTQSLKMNVEFLQMHEDSLQMLKKSLEKLDEIFNFMKSHGAFGTDDLLRKLISLQVQSLKMHKEYLQKQKESLQMLKECFEMGQEFLQQLAEDFNVLKSLQAADAERQDDEDSGFDGDEKDTDGENYDLNKLK